MNKSPFYKMERGVPKSDTLRTGSYMISISLAIAGSRPRAGWLPALSKTYRNLHFLPLASWNLGKKINIISPSPMRMNDVQIMQK